MATLNQPVIVALRYETGQTLRCEHCGVSAKWPETGKLAYCDRPGHPVGIRRANDNGSFGCWVCPACMEPYPESPKVVRKRAKRARKMGNDDQLSMFD